jgi:hypothetical protein
MQEIYTYNFSTDDEYHSQINNKSLPFSSCNFTSDTMALKQSNIDLSNFYKVMKEEGYEGKQEEDFLTDYAMTIHYQEMLDFMHKETPWAFDKEGNVIYPPNQIHQVIEYVTNKIMGRTVSKFSTKWTIKDIVQHLFIYNGGVVLSGMFPMTGRLPLGHIVSLAGFKSSIPFNKDNPNSIDITKITHFIIDDPYGNWYTEYQDHHGNNIDFSFTDFYKIFNDSNSNYKWAHLIREY